MQVERDLKNQAEPFITFSSLTEAAAKLRMLHVQNAVLFIIEELGFVIHDVSGSIKCVCFVHQISKITYLVQFQMYTLGQKPTFYPEISKNLMFEKCEFCEK